MAQSTVLSVKAAWGGQETDTGATGAIGATGARQQCGQQRSSGCRQLPWGCAVLLVSQQHKWSVSPAALSKPVTVVRATSTEKIKGLGNCWGGNSGVAGGKGGDVVQHSRCCQAQLLTCPSTIHQWSMGHFSVR